jgi:hypothetical protein
MAGTTMISISDFKKNFLIRDRITEKCANFERQLLTHGFSEKARSVNKSQQFVG